MWICSPKCASVCIKIRTARSLRIHPHPPIPSWPAKIDAHRCTLHLFFCEPFIIIIYEDNICKSVFILSIRAIRSLCRLLLFVRIALICLSVSTSKSYLGNTFWRCFVIYSNNTRMFLILRSVHWCASILEG